MLNTFLSDPSASTGSAEACSDATDEPAISHAGCVATCLGLPKTPVANIANPAAVVAVDATYFDALFAESSDPWKFASRWYEERKRALTLACLPQARYASAYEPGCANGELSAALATRCDRLLVTDGSERAVELARQRLAAWPQVEVRQAWVPDQWPEERFELIVLSEFLYYLAPDALDTLINRVRHSLAPGGCVLACHWRPRIGDCALDGDAVHQRLDGQLGLPKLSALLEPDFRMDVWSDAASVASREGPL